MLVAIDLFSFMRVPLLWKKRLPIYQVNHHEDKSLLNGTGPSQGITKS